MLHVRDAGHLDFNGNGDLLLHLFGGASRPLRNHVDVVVGYVGIRLDRQIMEGDGAPDKQQNGNRQHHEPVVKCKINQTTNHYWSTEFFEFQRIGHNLLAGSEAGGDLLLSIRDHGAPDHADSLELFVSRRHINPVPIVQVEDRGCRHGGVVLSRRPWKVAVANIPMRIRWSGFGT